MVAAARPQCQPGLVLAAPSGWSPCWDLFDGSVRIQGMNPTVQAMANVVVAQRLTVLTV
jgi:hypothetical protein